MKMIKKLDGQQNLFDQGFEKGECLLDSKYPCTHYWAVRTMQGCDGIDCERKCCNGCLKELCGYRCNACRESRVINRKIHFRVKEKENENN